jgi:hypothetical protein
MKKSMPAIMTPSNTRNNNPRMPFLLTPVNIKPAIKPKESNNMNMSDSCYS